MYIIEDFNDENSEVISHFDRTISDNSVVGMRQNSRTFRLEVSERVQENAYENNNDDYDNNAYREEEEKHMRKFYVLYL
jgi:hypothetical protein